MKVNSKQTAVTYDKLLEQDPGKRVLRPDGSDYIVLTCLGWRDAEFLLFFLVVFFEKESHHGVHHFFDGNRCVEKHNRRHE